MSLFCGGDLHTLADAMVPSLQRQHVPIILCQVDVLLASVVVDSRYRLCACHSSDHSVVVSCAVLGAVQRVALSACSSALLGRPFEVRVCRSTAGGIGKKSREELLNQGAEGGQTGR